MSSPARSSAAWRARRAVGAVIRRLARPALAGPGSPVQELAERVETVERTAGAADSVRGSIEEVRVALAERAADDLEWRTELTHGLDSVRRRVEAAETRLRRLDDHVDSARALPAMAQELETFDAPGAGRVVGFTSAGGDAASAYVAFEDVFRGDEERIRELQRPYVALLDGHAPVLDVGCGRGELLDLLRDAGIEAAGVDTDPGMIERCRAKGHDRVVEADGVAYVEGLDAGSVGALVSMQVVEHLPFATLQRLLAASARALRPGGVLIAETVNPHAPDALKGFWLDPTHQHPLFPEVLLTLCRIAGFASGYAFHPNGTGDVEADRFRSPAYAVVATAPA